MRQLSISSPSRSKRLMYAIPLVAALLIAVALPVAAGEPVPYLVKDINPGGDGCDPMILATMSGLVFFHCHDGIHGDELWKSDGTEQGTVMVKDINPGPEHSEPNHLFPMFGTLYFNADDGVHGRELWKSDGTEQGTVMVMDINPGSGSSYPSWFHRIGDKLLFEANDGSHGGEVWALDISPIPMYSVYLPLVLRNH